MNNPQNPLMERFNGNLESIEVIAPEFIEEFHKKTSELPFAEDAEPKSIFEDHFIFERKGEVDQSTSKPKVVWDSKRFDIEFIPLVKEEQDESMITHMNDKVRQTNDETISASSDVNSFGNNEKNALAIESLEEGTSVINNIDEDNKKTSVENDISTNDVSSDDGLKPFNVFEDLFRSCDVCKKLILMDEIAAIGDERDIDFIGELVDDSDPKIARKGKKVLRLLQKKLEKKEEIVVVPTQKMAAQEAVDQPDHIDGTLLLEYSLLLDEMEIEPPRNPNIFEVGFELSKQVPLENPNTRVGQKTS